ncbi:MAG TPA: NAD-dependent epimerase/dehydratase family protein, partial [Kofleriaceae bacterium]
MTSPQVQQALDAVVAAVGQVGSVDILRAAAYPPYEGGPLPPRYGDAGAPFRELGVDCLSLMQALLGPIEDVEAEWSSLGGEPDLAFDEWRAVVRCQRGLGQFQITFNTRPLQSQLVIHGARGVLRVNLAATGTPLRKAARLLQVFGGKEARAAQAVRDLVTGAAPAAAANDAAPAAAADDAAPAAAADDAGEVARAVDKVARAADADHRARLQPFTLSDRVPYLVTGASGSLGKAVVQRLLADGHKLRVFQRRIPAAPQPGVEYAIGNLGDPAAVDRAVKGVAVVLHCGAAMKGGWAAHKAGTVIATQNVIDSCRKHGVAQLVHISSMSVIDWAGSDGAGPVSEAAKLEPRAGERGDYTRAKLEAERLVAEAAAGGLPAVILRPGQIFGGGIPLINGAVARSAGGRWLILGDGKLELPLVYLDDVVDAIVAAAAKQLTHGEVIQLIDPEHLTQEQVLGLAGGGRPILRVPRPIVLALGKLSEYPLGVLGRQSPVAAYRLRSALARLHYESDRALQLLDWKPRVGVREGI